MNQQITISQIATLLNQFKDELKRELKDDFASKKDLKIIKKELFELKDIIIEIRKELDTEHEVRAFRIGENTKRIDTIENEVRFLKSEIST